METEGIPVGYAVNKCM